MTPGAALLFPDHPYNVAYDKLNEKFLGASQLIVIADTKRPDGIKALGALDDHGGVRRPHAGREGRQRLDDHRRHRQAARRGCYHDGDPKWGLIPENPKEIGQLFYVFTQNAPSAGDLDRFMDPSARYGSIITLFHEHSHDDHHELHRLGEAVRQQHAASDVAVPVRRRALRHPRSRQRGGRELVLDESGADLRHRLLLSVPHLRLVGTRAPS